MQDGLFVIEVHIQCAHQLMFKVCRGTEISQCLTLTLTDHPDFTTDQVAVSRPAPDDAPEPDVTPEDYK